MAEAETIVKYKKEEFMGIPVTTLLTAGVGVLGLIVGGMAIKVFFSPPQPPQIINQQAPAPENGNGNGNGAAEMPQIIQDQNIIPYNPNSNNGHSHSHNNIRSNSRGGAISSRAEQMMVNDKLNNVPIFDSPPATGGIAVTQADLERSRQPQHQQYQQQQPSRTTYSSSNQGEGIPLPPAPSAEDMVNQYDE